MTSSSSTGLSPVKGSGGDLLALGRTMKDACQRNVGVPVCVGIAPTKTLAKLANKWAKHNPAFAGVCRWESVLLAKREALMSRLSVIEIWGVAARLTKRLYAMGIHSGALNLRRLEFTGTGVGLFGLWIKCFVLIVITIGIYAFWVASQPTKWKTENVT